MSPENNRNKQTETTCAKQRCSTAVLVKLQGRSRVTFAMTLCILHTPNLQVIVRFVDSYDHLLDRKI
jgi:hypothetical protein